MTVGQGSQDESLNEWAVNKYDAISKAVFDARDNVQLAKTLEKADSFNAGVVQILRDAGVPDRFLKGAGGEPVGTTEWKATVESMADYGAELFVDTAIGGLLTYIGRPDLIPGAVSATHKVTGYFSQMKKDADAAKLELLNAGQWVLINNGPPPNAELGFKDSNRRRIFWSSDSGPPPDQISAGFFVGPASAAAYVTVFNFFTFKKEDHRLVNVAPANTLKTAELEGNPVMKKIRDLFFAKEPGAKMISRVPTDPGTEVIYKGLLYHITKTEGSEALIEDVHGQRLVVSIDTLERGRVKHTNAWNYRQGKPFNTGFEADGSAAVYSGQWVWIAARPELHDAGITPFELAVVWKLERDGAYTFNAFDGDLVVVDRVFPVSPTVADSFSSKKNFIKFRMAAVEGVNTHKYSLGSDELLICIGGTQDPQMGFPTADTPGEIVVHRETAGVVETAGDERMKTAIDNAVEIQRDASNVNSAQVLRAIATDQDPTETEEFADSRTGGNSLFAYGAIAAGVLFLFNSIGGL